MNLAIKMPISFYCAALSQRAQDDQVRCMCPCCTFWPLDDKNPTLTATSALVANYICSCLQFPLTSIAVQLYVLRQLCTKNTPCNDKPELGTIAVPACIVR